MTQSTSEQVKSNFPAAQFPAGHTYLSDLKREEAERKILDAVIGGDRYAKQIMVTAKLSYSAVWRGLGRLVSSGDLAKTGACPAVYSIPGASPAQSAAKPTKRAKSAPHKRKAKPKAVRVNKSSRVLSDDDLERREEAARALRAAQALAQPAFRHPYDVALFGEYQKAA